MEGRISLKEAAKRVHYNRHSLADAIRLGRLPAVWGKVKTKRGNAVRTYFVLPEDVEAYMRGEWTDPGKELVRLRGRIEALERENEMLRKEATHNRTH